MIGGDGLTISGLVKRYGNQTVVNDVSLTVADGEFFSLLGPSGSGKTSTLMMIAGFTSVDNGRILAGGRDISGLTPQQRGLGMVFQNYALFPHLTVFDNVAFPLQIRKLPRRELRERVAWALDVVRLGDFSKRLPRELSGGQQQRVALARTIVFHPKVILMDEPLGALDKNLRYHMQVELKEIQRQLGMTVVYVTHDQEEAMNMSDRIAIMNQGRIEQMGPPSQVYENPSTVFVAKFLGEANLIQPASLQGSVPSERLQAMAPDGSVLFLRPERISLLPPDTEVDEVDGWMHRAGRVERVSFLGNVIRYAIEAQGVTLIADAQNARGLPRFETGDPIIVRWRDDDARVLSHV